MSIVANASKHQSRSARNYTSMLIPWRFSRVSGIAILARSFQALLLLMSYAQAQTLAPTITSQPRNQSVSLGANVTFLVTATGTAPLTYQWLWNQDVIETATNASYILTNITVSKAGSYSVIVSNSAGSATSAAAILTVDTAFTKITLGLIATEGGDSSGCAWGDFDNDGFPDLFVANGTTRNFLYHNKGDGTFEKLTNAVPARDSGYGASWGDFDND